MQYYAGVYPEDHWAFGNGGDFYVGRKGNCVLKLNPCDSRCYRLLAWHENEVNREFSREERRQLFDFVLDVEWCLREVFKIPHVQIIQAGNDSNSVSQDGQFLIGNAQHPSMLQVHIVCRGIVGRDYFTKVPLTGPQPGVALDLRGNGDGQANCPWSDHDRSMVRKQLAECLDANDVTESVYWNTALHSLKTEVSTLDTNGWYRDICGKLDLIEKQLEQIKQNNQLLEIARKKREIIQKLQGQEEKEVLLFFADESVGLHNYGSIPRLDEYSGHAIIGDRQLSLFWDNRTGDLCILMPDSTKSKWVPTNMWKMK